MSFLFWAITNVTGQPREQRTLKEYSRAYSFKGIMWRFTSNVVIFYKIGFRTLFWRNMQPDSFTRTFAAFDALEFLVAVQFHAWLFSTESPFEYFRIKTCRERINF